MSVATPPLPEDFQEPLQRVLALLVHSKEAGTKWLTASQISASLLENHGISLHWRSIQTVLLANSAFAARRKRKRRWEFTITGPGREQVESGNNPIFFVNPTKAVKSVISLHEFFGDLKGSIRICDPYLDHLTMQHVEALTAATAIHLLTHKINNTPTLRAALTALGSTGKQVEVRRASSNILHDRYVIDDASMLILGTSLNSFGKKQCFVIRAGQDIRTSLLATFNQLWGAAAVWP